MEFYEISGRRKQIERQIKINCIYCDIELQKQNLNRHINLKHKENNIKYKK